MTSFEGRTPSETFKDILQVANNNSGIGGALLPISDGEGTVSPLELSTSLVRIAASRSLTLDANASIDLDGKNLVIDADGDLILNALVDDIAAISAQGTEVFRVDASVASPLNGIEVVASSSGSDVILRSFGGNTNINLDLQTKGTGSILADITGNITGNLTGDVTGNTNGIHTGNVIGNVTGNVTGDITGEVDLNGGNLTIDADADLILRASADDIMTVSSQGTDIFRIDASVASPLNGIEVVASPSGSAAILRSFGGNTNIDLDLQTKGTGSILADITGNVTGNVTGNLTGDVTGNTNGIHTGNVTGDVTGNTNGVHTGNVTGNVTGNLTGDVTGQVDLNGANLIIDADGDLIIRASADDILAISATGVEVLRIDGSILSHVNGLDIISSATGNAPAIKSFGIDTDIDLLLDGKGTGIVTLLSGELQSTGSELSLNPTSGNVKVSGLTSEVISTSSNINSSLEATSYFVDTTAGNRTLTLRSSDIAIVGKVFFIFHTTTANSLQVATEGAEDIDGFDTLNFPGISGVTLVSDGSNLFSTQI